MSKLSARGSSKAALATSLAEAGVRVGRVNRASDRLRPFRILADHESVEQLRRVHPPHAESTFCRPRLSRKANRRAADADAAETAARRALDRLPEGGEPIKVGHHSEGRHSNAIAKADAAMGRSVKAEREATRARARADVAAKTTDTRYAPEMVARRIERLATDIRGYTRKIEGSSHNFGGGYIETTAPATGAYRERLLTQRAQLEDEHTYWTAVREAQAAAGQVTIHSREMIAKGDMIKHRFGWHVVARVNPKSVTVALDWHDTTRLTKSTTPTCGDTTPPPRSRPHEPPAPRRQPPRRPPRRAEG